MNLTEEEIMDSLEKAYRNNPKMSLHIYSRRQDIGIMKCEFGVEKGLLRKEVIRGEQSERWKYDWTEKAVAIFNEKYLERTTR